MKKFLIIMLTLILAVPALFAGETEDIKTLLGQFCTWDAEGNFTEKLAHLSPDFVEVDRGVTVNYEQTKWWMISLDGKHPEEYRLLLNSFRKMIDPDASELPGDVVRNPEFVRDYEELTAKLRAASKSAAALQLKTLKFVSVRIDGEAATAVIEYDAMISGEMTHIGHTMEMRKVGGVWKIHKSVVAIK